MVDNGEAQERRSPRIILGERWADEPSQRRSPDLLDWKTSFRRRSPLTRKIITFNLIALGLLVAGILYLNQFQGGLETLREQSLETEGQMMAAAVSEAITDTMSDVEQVGAALEALRPLATMSTARVRLYDAKGQFLGATNPTTEAEIRQAARPAVNAPSSSALISIMNEVWVRTERLFEDRDAEGAPVDAIFFNPVAKEATETGIVTRRQSNNEVGQTILTVAVPVLKTEMVVGAVALSTYAGDIDTFVRGEREQILQVFALAMISSIVLSFVLANTIVRPLRDLAEAAEKGGARDSRNVNPERIHIPDMTGRPDEIGYLSGAMQVMTTALYDRIEANEMFAADVAHEIKNPLTSLRSAVETMRYARDDEARAQLISVIEHDVRRLDRLVTDISNASRLDSELVRDEMEEFDLHQLLTNLVEYNVEMAEDKGATVVSVKLDNPLMLQGLEGRLAQVFVNLITNAISFAQERDVIRVSTRIKGKGVLITVEDEGPGIPDENLADVFSRFYSERPGQEFGNHSGLGLAISKQIIDAHGGEIWAENIRPDGVSTDIPPLGARFCVELPL